ncbi:alpha/beta hydrolase [Ideonella sp. B508-1]|uniref:alpha/beta hydrolase n=1 Tax=Ideonella sp. B508-1 TaxID=137716 RepID=UPI00034923C6|nr:alpha/beta hydrolase [Ideonella sp. B508-1]
MQDAQRALRLIRAQARDFQLDPARLGVLGFSAGGHLMGLAATRFGEAHDPPLDAISHQSARPTAAALIYPVITLLPPYEHTSTRRVLVGDHPDAALSRAWSVETGVNADCPPVFLLQAADDPISNPANTERMFEACRRAGVPVERHLLPSGGHGFGMGRSDGPTAQWPLSLASWMHGTLGTRDSGR